MQRWIIHIDMDAFFAAVEQRDNPKLHGQPVIVGGLGRRGVVSTASYEARRYGVHSAMPMSEARRRCPHGIYLPGNHRKYGKVAADIRRILADFSPAVEPLSLDEAFLDVSGMEWLYSDPPEIARKIKQRIRDELELTASAGVAPNKFLAKLASDWKKPDGLVVVRPGQEQAFLKDIPVSRLWGIGGKSANLLQSLGVSTIGQLARIDMGVLAKHFGNSAEPLRNLALGLDDRPVIPDHDPKSIGNEVTFEEDLHSPEELETILLALTQKVCRRLRQSGLSGRTITVKMRFASFRTITRSRTLGEPTLLDHTIFETAQAILGTVPLAEGVRLLGVTVSNLHPYGGQTSLFSLEDDKHLKVCQTIDKLKDRFGETAVTRGRLLLPEMKK
ncbi:MAG TPA: DNA polymerase IV [Selenomonadales bacterium]|nr:DNA polymerase IV [Selenomonadales bacterium]